MNHVTHMYLGQNSMSFYQRVDGRTKSPSSAMVKIPSLSTYGWKVEPSHSQSAWDKVLSYPIEGWMDKPSQKRVPGSKF